MKRLMKLLPLLVLVLFTGCSSLFSDWEVKEVKHTPDQAKVWNVTLVNSIKENVLIKEWYGNENPIIYLRKTGKMDEKEFKFLEALGKKEVSDITQEDLDKFDGLVIKYNKKLEREFYIMDENIKDGKGLVKKMVKDSREKLDTPAKWFSENVMEPEDWKKIVALSEKSDLTEDDITDIRKILNRVMEEENFFKYTYWLNIEVSERTEDLIRLANMNPKESELVQNNLNAKAMFIAYSDYLSAMDRWDN